MTIELPLFMQANDYSARLVRMLVASMHDEGVMDLTALKVTQRGAGANFSVDVSAGDGVIEGDDQADQGNYYARSTAVENVPIDAAPGSNSRYDIIVMRMDDAVAGGAAGDDGKIVAIAGTASATPTAPAVPDSAMLLATIGPIASGTASITNSIISDNRVLAGKKDEVGTLKAQTGTSLPSGWLWCDGSAVSRATYAALFAEIATSYGVGNGSTTFNLPDFRERDPLARGTTLTTIGATGGSKDAIVVSHTHTGPSHTHTGPSHTHTGPSHTHTGPSHTHIAAVHSHSIDHDHAAANTSADNAHSHAPLGADMFFARTATGGSLAIQTAGGTEAWANPTLTAGVAAHTHSVNLPGHAGDSGAAGALATDPAGTGATGASGTGATGADGTGNTGASGTGATGSTGSSGTNANRTPYQVIGGWRIRT